MFIVIGNIIAFLASLLMVYSGVVKSKKQIIYIQSIQIGLFIASNLVLGGITGAIINALSLIRNILCYKNRLGFKEKVIITVLSIIFSLLFNNLGFIGLLPLISTVLYIWLIDLKNVIQFKLLLSFTMLLWGIYDFYIKSYTSFVFDVASIIANTVSIYQLTKIKK